MRKLALLTTAIIGLASVSSFAQPANSGPQPGLPPGASIGAPNAVQPSPTGRVSTTTVAPAPMASAPEPYNPPAHVSRHRARHHRMMHHPRHMRHHAAPAPVDAAPAANQ